MLVAVPIGLAFALALLVWNRRSAATFPSLMPSHRSLRAAQVDGAEVAERLARLYRQESRQPLPMDPVTNPFVIRTVQEGPQNYYVILGISQTASDKEIQAAYIRNMRLVHPDQFFNDPERFKLAQEKFKQLNIARQVLGDPIQRTQHDRMLIREAYRENKIRWGAR